MGDFLSDWWNGRASINPVSWAWNALPQNVRDTYTSGFRSLVDMSTPASIRDYTTSAQDTARSAMQGDGWGAATNALGTVNAALGAIPIAGMGVTLARKGAQDVGKAVGMGVKDAERVSKSASTHTVPELYRNGPDADPTLTWFLDGDKKIYANAPTAPDTFVKTGMATPERAAALRGYESISDGRATVWHKPGESEAAQAFLETQKMPRTTQQELEAWHRAQGLALGYSPESVDAYIAARKQRGLF